MQICTEHGSVPVVLCAKFHNDATSDTVAMNKRDFTRFHLEADCDRICCIATRQESMIKGDHISHGVNTGGCFTPVHV